MLNLQQTLHLQGFIMKKKHYEHIYEFHTFDFCKYLRIKQSLNFIFSSFEHKGYLTNINSELLKIKNNHNSQICITQNITKKVNSTQSTCIQ